MNRSLDINKADFRCDAEIGKPPHWHVCQRPAAYAVFTGQSWLHFCAAHEKHAQDCRAPLWMVQEIGTGAHRA